MQTKAEGLCKHCGMPIVLIEFIQGDKWLHRLNSDPIRELEDLGLYCKTTVAEPSVEIPNHV